MSARRVKVGQPWQSSDDTWIGNPAIVGFCAAQHRGPEGFLCCRRAMHPMPHIAGNGIVVVAVWS